MLDTKILVYKGDIIPEYTITSKGEIINSKGKVLKQRKNNRGYFIIDIYPKPKNKKTCLVHRLVAESFIINGDPNHTVCVNHKDGNKENNCVDNLEWVSYAYNNTHAVKTGLRRSVPIGHNFNDSRINEEIAEKICELLEINCSFDLIIKVLDIGHIRNIKNTISLIKNKQLWTRVSKDFLIYNNESDYYAIEYEYIYAICEFIEQQKSYEYTMKVLGLEPSLRMKTIYNGLRDKKIYHEITALYNY